MADEQQNDQNIKQLRDAADAGKAATEKALLLERENAMLRAGVDLDSKAGQYFAKGYDGELTAEAIKQEAEDFQGALRGSTTPPPKEEGNEEKPDPTKQQETNERLDLQSGAGGPGAQQEPNPYDGALRDFTEAMASGQTRETASAAAFDRVLKAGIAGDKRVRLDLEQ